MKKTVGVLVLSAFLLTGCTNSETMIKVGKEKITKDDLLTVLLTEGNMSLVERKINDVLLFETGKVSDKEILSEIDEMKKEFKVKNIVELKTYLSLEDASIRDMAKRRILENKLLIKKANISKEEIEQLKQSSEGAVFANFISYETKEEADTVLKKTSDNLGLERSAHKNSEEYYLSYKWMEQVPGEAIPSLIELKTGEIADVLEINNRFYIFEKEEKTTTFYQSTYNIVHSLASEKGILIEDLYQTMRTNIKLDYENDTLKELTSN